MTKPREKPYRILIGEDTVEIAHLMRRTLERRGYEVHCTFDGESCLAEARSHPPDLLILDIMMPKMHGIDVLRAVNADPALESVPVLICTAKDYETEREKAELYGAKGVLAKPFYRSELLRAVEGLLGTPSAGDAAGDTEGGAEEEEAPPPYTPSPGLDQASFTLWGARGSIPTPGPRFLRHGGNTSCLSVIVEDECFIFDAGSGIRELGLHLLEHPPRAIHLFITHTHWDHIQGFPFFAPAYLAGARITVYGAQGFGKDLRRLFQGQLDRDYFPVRMEDMKADIRFRTLPDGPVALDPASVSWEFVQHPGATVGYKIQVDGKTVAWVPDNEFLLGYTGDPSALDRTHPRVQPFEHVIRFLEGVDLAIHEGQYTPAEYPAKIRWGHSSIANAALLMKLAGVRRWVVTHHDPLHDDAFLEGKLNLTRRILSDLDHPILVSHGYDGLTEPI